MTTPQTARRLRVCMVTNQYYPSVGGIADHVHFLSRELRRHGHAVSVLTTSFNGTTAGTRHPGMLEQVPDAQYVSRLGRGVLVPANRSYAWLPTAWRPTRLVRDFFDRSRFDVVHIHGCLAPSLPLASLRASRAVNVLTFHTTFKNSFWYAMLRPALLPYFNMIHGLVAVSESARTATGRYFPGPYRIIPNAVDSQFFRPDAPPAPGLERRPRILFMGRFEPRKGLKYLLRALPLVAARVPGVELVVAGAGPFAGTHVRWLDRRYRDRVKWVGVVEHDARPGYYTGCDVFCSPATGNESFGIVLLEAMASQRPVVASDIPGYCEVVDHGTEGLLVPPRDEVRLAEALVAVLESPDLAGRMGQAGRAKAHEYSWSHVAAEVEDLYRELLGRHPHPELGRTDGLPLKANGGLHGRHQSREAGESPSGIQPRCEEGRLGQD